MKSLGISPDVNTLNAGLSLFTENLRIYRAQAVFKDLFQEYKIEPNEQSYLRMLRMYSSTARSQDALNTIKEMEDKKISIGMDHLRCALYSCTKVRMTSL
jgi:hypothetical protein